MWAHEIVSNYLESLLCAATAAMLNDQHFSCGSPYIRGRLVYKHHWLTSTDNCLSIRHSVNLSAACSLLSFERLKIPADRLAPENTESRENSKRSQTAGIAVGLLSNVDQFQPASPG